MSPCTHLEMALLLKQLSFLASEQLPIEINKVGELPWGCTQPPGAVVKRQQRRHHILRAVP
jgi:hypothetical protein